MKVRLHQRTIDEASDQGPGGGYLWDTELTAFGLWIYPSGRTFRIREDPKRRASTEAHRDTSRWPVCGAHRQRVAVAVSLLDQTPC